MKEFYFLFFLAMAYVIFAVVQDIRTREVANWLNFSLLAIGLSYRIFYAIINKDIIFFLTGLFGVVVFFALAIVFYYGRIFAGGDAKLMMGLGTLLPAGNIYDMLILTALFVFVLFFIGAIYGVIYSFFLIKRNKRFSEYYILRLKKNKMVLFAGVFFGILLLTVYRFYLIGIISFFLFSSIGFLYYQKKSCRKTSFPPSTTLSIYLYSF